MKKLFLLFFFVVCFFNSRAQCCDSLVPTFNVDFTGAAAGTTWTSAPIARKGYCCAASGLTRCVQFVITTDSNTCGINFEQIAPDPGSYDLNLCCGTQFYASDTEYFSPGVHSITFCKPGNNVNQYQIISFTTCNGLSVKTNNDPQPKTISVYPNPANDKLTVQLPEILKGKIAFQIYDITGREVFTQSEIKNPKSEINVSSLQAGVYFLKINEGENAVVKRFLKQ